MRTRDASASSAHRAAKAPMCPVCRAPGAAGYAQGRDRLFGLSSGAFPLYRCAGCGCIFQHPMPDSSSLAGLYPRDYWWSEAAPSKSPAARFLQMLEKAYREFVVADHVRFLNFCARANPPDGKLLLDIGCGSGTFLHVARSHGFVPHGMDASARAADVARKQYGFPVRQGAIGSSVWDDCRFDFVTLFHVLEHLPDPEAGLRYAGVLLKPKGTLVLQVPNVRSIQARLFGSRWHGLDVPRHVINYSSRALGLLLRETGFEYRLVRRFSLRDNPASMASSIAPRLDPIGRKVRRRDLSPLLAGAAGMAYLGLFLLALPAAYAESVLGFGGTLWAYARRREGGT